MANTLDVQRLLHEMAVQALVFGAVLAVLNQDIPDFKDRVTAVIQTVSGNTSQAQNVVDAAVRYMSSL